ncbi:MAG: segregation/condensation protein A [Planctomycetaceae bacterium]|nr:segregation/condensation protein A [Planctomycetaceae bacterium]
MQSMFSAKLPFYQGPLDLLLYLVRKHELDILQVPLADVLSQYLEYLHILEQIDINNIGDFLAMASMLVEIKSYKAIPGEEVVEQEIETPKQELVQHLLEYKRYCDAARLLQQRSENWQLRFARLADDLPPRLRNISDEPIQEIEIWDLVKAFGRILSENVTPVKHEVVYDETPISTHMNRIHHRLKREKRIAFRQLFVSGQHKSTLVGIFLASLELVRHEFAHVYQEINFGEIELAYRQSSKSLDFSALSAC